MFRLLLYISICNCYTNLYAQTQLPIVSDRNEPSLIPFYNPPKKYDGYTSTSFYFITRDSTPIAIDLYLPRGLKEGDKIPAIISQTRYWRSLELTPLAKLLAEKKINKPGNRIGYLGEIFPSHGYAWLDVDVRGTGASGGSRAWDLSPIEIADGNEIVNWVVKQSWSNGRVGATGLSYSSETSERLLINQNPAVKAVAARFNPFDLYEDLAFPGGVPNVGFFTEWGKIEKELDNNTIPEIVPAKDAKFLKGVKVPRGTSRNSFQRLIRPHRFNYDFAATMNKVIHRDDLPLQVDSSNSRSTNDVLTNAFKSIEEILGKDFRSRGVDIASTHTFFQQIDQSGTPMYFYSGWYDGGFANAAIKKFLSYSNQDNHLILGPWDHGGFYNISPYDNSPSVFDHHGELLKFFDTFLKTDAESPYERQSKVLYYTMVQDRWKKSDRWPVASVALAYYLKPNKMLDPKQVDTVLQSGFDLYETDTTATTGTITRWSSLTRGPLHNPYQNRKEEDQKLLTYTSEPLTDSLVITGHPIIELYLSSNSSDGAIFVYLEDIDTTGEVNYVTEGELRLIHRKIGNKKDAPYTSVQPFRSYLSKDSSPMESDRVEKIEIPMQPTSYLFKKNHRVRVAIAGADRDNFAIIPKGTRATYKLFRNETYPSRIVLQKTDQ